MLRVSGPAQDETVIAEAELLAVVIKETAAIDPEEIFEEAGAKFSRKSCQFAPEVDRPLGLRAR